MNTFNDTWFQMSWKKIVFLINDAGIIGYPNENVKLDPFTVHKNQFQVD